MVVSKRLEVVVYLTFLVCHIKDSLHATFTETFAAKWGIHTDPFDLTQDDLGPWPLTHDPPNCM